MNITKIAQGGCLNVLVLSGVHGNETHANAAITKLCNKVLEEKPYSGLINEIVFITDINTYGLEQDTRDNNYEEKPVKDCNRLFTKNYKTSEQIKSTIQVLSKNCFDLVLDVHNSPMCFPCALIDYDVKAKELMRPLLNTEIRPLLRTTNASTIKRYFNKGNTYTYAYTIELPGMGVIGNINKSVELVDDFIIKVCKYIKAHRKSDVTFDFNLDKYLVEPLCSMVDNGYIVYSKNTYPVGYYHSGDIICNIYKNSNYPIQTVTAPYDGILFDVDDNIYSYSGKQFGLYGRDFSI